MYCVGVESQVKKMKKSVLAREVRRRKKTGKRITANGVCMESFLSFLFCFVFYSVS